ncbi:hypothetical protein D3C87_76050 [compost metagenome]
MRDTINDCFVDIENIRPTQEQIDLIIKLLPIDIKNIAELWGQYDTEFREKVYAWLKDNILKIK